MVDNVLELFDLMAYEDSDLKSMYITDVIEDGKEVLYLDVTRVYKRISKYIKDNNLKDFEYVNEKDFKKQLKDSSYCLDNRYNKGFKFYDSEFRKEQTKVVKCFKLDLKKMGDKLDLRTLKIYISPEFEK